MNRDCEHGGCSEKNISQALRVSVAFQSRDVFGTDLTKNMSKLEQADATVSPDLVR